MVAGGASADYKGGTGGGNKGGKNNRTRTDVVATQTSGYDFGKGQDGWGIADDDGVGGGRRWLVWRICQQCI